MVQILLLQLQGERSKNINLVNTNTARAKQKISAGFGATEAMVNWGDNKAIEVKKTKEKGKVVSKN